MLLDLYCSNAAAAGGVDAAVAPGTAVDDTAVICLLAPHPLGLVVLVGSKRVGGAAAGLAPGLC